MWKPTVGNVASQTIMKEMLFAMSAFVTTGTAVASTTQILVPAYFDPTTYYNYTQGKIGAPTTDPWYRLINSGGKAPITAVINPNSGPVSCNPTQMSTQCLAYERAVNDAHLHGISIVAYVPTGYGADDLVTSVEQNVQTYLQDAGVPGHIYSIDGFFFDEMAGGDSRNDGCKTPAQNDCSTYYISLHNYVKSLGTYKVIGNPGTTYADAGAFNASNLPLMDDLLVEFEDNGTRYARTSSGQPAPWVLNMANSALATIVYSVSASSIATTLQLTATRYNAGWVYLTNRSLLSSGGPYADLDTRGSGFWSSFVSQVCLSNGGSGC